MSNQKTEKKVKQAPITDFITRKSSPKSLTAGKSIILTVRILVKVE